MFEIITNVVCINGCNRFATACHVWMLSLTAEDKTYRRLDERQISIGIFSRSTMSRAAEERKVACPRRNGPNDKRYCVSSSVFAEVWRLELFIRTTRVVRSC